MNVRELKKTVDNLCVIVVNIASTGRLTFNGRTAQREKRHRQGKTCRKNDTGRCSKSDWFITAGCQ